MVPTQPVSVSATRVHLARLLQIWRSAGWPSRDAIEIDLLAAGWVAHSVSVAGHETLRLTESGIQLLAQARQRNQRALSPHDRLAERVARQLMASGRVVWRELSLRALANGHESADTSAAPSSSEALWSSTPHDGGDDESVAAGDRAKASWRIARPDVFSVRNTSVEDYLQPMVHEVKVSRADLLSDLRHAAKRESYRWLCCECYYVFPFGIAQPDEIPEAFGVWALHGPLEAGQLELLRPARHSPCKLPFPVWLALAKAAPLRLDDADAMQAQLGEPECGPPPDASGTAA